MTKALIYGSQIVAALPTAGSQYDAGTQRITWNSSLPAGYTRVDVDDVETAPSDVGLDADAIDLGFSDDKDDLTIQPDGSVTRDRQWRQRTLDEAKRDARQKADEYERLTRDMGLPRVLPAGATLNGVAADSQPVRLDYEPSFNRTETDWVKYGVKLTQRSLYPTEEFDVQEGRVTIPGAELPAFLTFHSDQSSQAETIRNRIISQIRRAPDRATCDAIAGQIQIAIDGIS